MTNEPENNKCNTPQEFKPESLKPIKFLKSEIQGFRNAFSGYRYELQEDGDFYIASNFVSYKDLQAKILAEGIAKINDAKPVYVFKDYEHKAKHQKCAIQKENECAKRRLKNKNRKQRK